MSESFDPYHRWLGIRPEEQPANHYRMLGLAVFEDDPEAIRDAAARQMAHVRTYQLGSHMETSQRILTELGAAKACLSNPQKKAVYDAILRDELARSERTKADDIVPSKRGGDVPPAPPFVLAQPRMKWHFRHILPALTGVLVVLVLLLAMVLSRGTSTAPEFNRDNPEIVLRTDPLKTEPPTTPALTNPEQSKTTDPVEKPPPNNPVENPKSSPNTTQPPEPVLVTKPVTNPALTKPAETITVAKVEPPRTEKAKTMALPLSEPPKTTRPPEPKTGSWIALAESLDDFRKHWRESGKAYYDPAMKIISLDKKPNNLSLGTAAHNTGWREFEFHLALKEPSKQPNTNSSIMLGFGGSLWLRIGSAVAKHPEGVLVRTKYDPALSLLVVLVGEEEVDRATVMDRRWLDDEFQCNLHAPPSTLSRLRLLTVKSTGRSTDGSSVAAFPKKGTRSTNAARGGWVTLADSLDEFRSHWRESGKAYYDPTTKTIALEHKPNNTRLGTAVFGAGWREFECYLHLNEPNNQRNRDDSIMLGFGGGVRLRIGSAVAKHPEGVLVRTKYDPALRTLVVLVGEEEADRATVTDRRWVDDEFQCDLLAPALVLSRLRLLTK